MHHALKSRQKASEVAPVGHMDFNFSKSRYSTLLLTNSSQQKYAIDHLTT